MSEKDDAVRLANKVLDTPYRDPDDDLSMMSRQFLRAIESKWQAIETAPKDGTDILVWTGAGCVVTDWYGYGDHVTYAATHWMPLPEPPA